MNEKIQELAEQANEYASQRATGDWEVGPAYQNIFNKKFAELIVQECAKESRLAVQRAFDHGLTNTIPEYVEVAVCRHFGVG